MEQTETSAQARAKRGANAMVERKLVQVLTPSTLTEGIVKPDAIHLLAYKEEERFLETKSSFLCGFSFIDVAAGRCYVGSFVDDSSHCALESLLMQVAPQEFLYEVGCLSAATLNVVQRYSRPGLLPMFMTPLQAGSEYLNPGAVVEMISSQGYFRGEASARWTELSASIADKDNAAVALGALVTHLSRVKMDSELPNALLSLYELYGGSLRLDGQTIANLELLENSSNGSKTGTLIEFLDNCATSFGKRLLRRWVCHPLRDMEAINQRLDAVEELAANTELASSLHRHLRRIPDMERLVARIRAFPGTSDALPFSTKRTFQRKLKTLCLAVQGMRRAYDAFKRLEEANINAALLKAAYNTTTDTSLSDCLSTIEAEINTETVSLAAKQEVDDECTLSWLLAEFNQHGAQWSSIVDALACLDVMLAFASIASTPIGPTCRPQFHAAGGSTLCIKGLWHPFARASGGGAFVPNDVTLGFNSPRAVLLTGPNMGGKSTLLRATCLAALMAQLGCFVPGESCTLSPVDTIFTRIGARDRIMSGESTFMVECQEAASILHHATSKSLVVLDELGRGTSTFDGYAVAYAVFRHLVEQVQCRLLFATHYHPLIQEFAANPGVAVQHMACELDVERRIVFLYKLREGACPESYGLEVALLAGIPSSVVEAASRARAKMRHSQQQSETGVLVRRILERGHSVYALWRQVRNKELVHAG